MVNRSIPYHSIKLLDISFTDDSALLLFLRTKKYNLNESFKAYEKHFKYRAKRKEWFDVTDDVTYSRMRALIERGSRFVIVDRNSTAPATFIQRFRGYENIDSPGSDVFYSSLIIGTALCEIEKVQICGFRMIVDFTDVPPTSVAQVSISDVIDFTSLLTAGTGRFKQIIIVNLPTLLHVLFNIIKMMLPEKLRKRLFMVKDYDKLKDITDTTLLPPPFGNSPDEGVYIKETLQLLDTANDILVRTNDFEIDLKRASKSVTRKSRVPELEVD